MLCDSTPLSELYDLRAGSRPVRPTGWKRRQVSMPSYHMSCLSARNGDLPWQTDLLRLTSSHIRRSESPPRRICLRHDLRWRICELPTGSSFNPDSAIHNPKLLLKRLGNSANEMPLLAKHIRDQKLKT